jgi:dynein heavy chain, axonemal
MNMFQQYVLRVKAMIHVVICFSPMGDIFADRLRRFPSLVNCCTIDWYSNWPAEALDGVGKGQLNEDAESLKI